MTDREAVADLAAPRPTADTRSRVVAPRLHWYALFHQRKEEKVGAAGLPSRGGPFRTQIREDGPATPEAHGPAVCTDDENLRYLLR
jgi:hypothetical protein